jgi:hypothetical protein
MAENPFVQRWREFARAAIPNITDEEIRQIDKEVIDSVGRPSRDSILNVIRNLASYKARYPAFSYMYNSGQLQSESQYRALETEYRKVVSEYLGDASDIMSTPDKLAQFMTNDVSVVEVRDRLVQASNLLATAPEEYKQSLSELYGIDENYQLAFLVDPETTKPALDKKANDMVRATTLATRARQEGLSISAQDVQNLTAETQSMFGDRSFAAADVEVANAMKRAALMAQQDRRLAAIEQTQYSDIEAVGAQFGDIESAMQSQRRAERERARFGGSAGVGATSLGTERNF